MLIATTPSKFARGVERPGFKPNQTYDWRYTDQRNTREVRPVLTVRPLVEALHATYTTDAHLVAYVVCQDDIPLGQQPRVNKSALDWLNEQGFTISSDVLLADIDNPAHTEWTPELRERFDQLWQSCPGPLATAGVYLTQHGYRLIQPLDEPISVATVERTIAGWHAELRAIDLEPDPQCRDWTRLYRLPHVRRGRADYRSPFIDLSRMQPRAITPAAPTPKDVPVATGGQPPANP